MSRIRATLSKIKFYTGYTPVIPKYNNIEIRKFIPEPYKAVVIIWADLELAWGWRYAKHVMDAKSEAINRAKIARKNVPIILELCEKYDIPITWATVGHLMLEECHRTDGIAHPEIEHMPYHENKFWRFTHGDWFDDDPCTDWKNAPEWYAPDLIKMILSFNVKHEVACHTFSHIDCSDKNCPTKVFTSEITACINLASKYGIQLKSIVFPGNTIGHVELLKTMGIKVYRNDTIDTLDIPHKRQNIWEIRSTHEIKLNSRWSINYHIYRYKTIIERAIRHNRVCAFWFHPSSHGIVAIFSKLFEYLSYLHKNELIFITSASNYADYLDATI